MKELKTLRDMNLPILFHNFYEEEADKVGWETNRKCRVKFDDLPETNQETMIRTCERIKNELKAEAVKWVKKDIKDSVFEPCTIISKPWTDYGSRKMPNGKFCSCEPESICTYHREGRRVMEMNNLTEEDLK